MRVWLVSLLVALCGAQWSSSRVWSGGMQYVRVCPTDSNGASCKHFSRLIMGSDHLAASGWVANNQTEPKEPEVFAVLDAAMNAGINTFDTSPIYVGGIENLLGRWRMSRLSQGLQQGKNPDNALYVISKAGFPFDLYWSKSLPAGSHSPELLAALQAAGIYNESTPKNPDGSMPLSNVPPGTYASRLYGDEEQITQRVAEELGHILQNLHDNVTVLLMHRDDADYVRFAPVARAQTPVETIMGALLSPKIAPNVWAFGWSNWRTERVVDALAKAPSLRFPLLFNSPYFSLLEMNRTRSIHAGGVQALHAEMGDAAFQRGILFDSYSPLGGWSVFDQRVAAAQQWQQARANAVAHTDDAYWMNVLAAIFTDDNADRFQRLLEMTAMWNAKYGVQWTLDQMANAYALSHSRADFLTVGPITVPELARTVQALGLAQQLSPAVVDYLYEGGPPADSNNKAH